MKRLFSTVAAIALLSLGACTQAQVAAVSAYQTQITQACGVAMMLAPVAGPIAPWIIGGCATEAAIAKLALDPTSLQWVNGLVAKAKGVA